MKKRFTTGTCKISEIKHGFILAFPRVQYVKDLRDSLFS
jgi:hypothetical protein